MKFLPPPIVLGKKGEVMGYELVQLLLIAIRDLFLNYYQNSVVYTTMVTEVLKCRRVKYNFLRLLYGRSPEQVTLPLVYPAQQLRTLVQLISHPCYRAASNFALRAKICYFEQHLPPLLPHHASIWCPVIPLTH